MNYPPRYQTAAYVMTRMPALWASFPREQQIVAMLRCTADPRSGYGPREIAEVLGLKPQDVRMLEVEFRRAVTAAVAPRPMPDAATLERQTDDMEASAYRRLDPRR